MQIVAVAAVLYGAMGLVAAWLVSNGVGYPIVHDATLGHIAYAIALGAGVAAAILAGTELLLRTSLGRRLRDTMAETLGPLRFPEIAFLAIASGFAEELLFRGALQPRFGLIATSLVFGLVHFGPTRIYQVWTAFAILAGFILGILTQWTGILLPAIVAHVLVNLVNLSKIAAAARRSPEAL